MMDRSTGTFLLTYINSIQRSATYFRICYVLQNRQLQVSLSFFNENNCHSTECHSAFTATSQLTTSQCRSLVLTPIELWSAFGMTNFVISQWYYFHLGHHGLETPMIQCSRNTSAELEGEVLVCLRCVQGIIQIEVERTENINDPRISVCAV
jgi:hypothetical protein